MTAFQMPEPRPYNEPFWDAAANGRLVVQHCPACDTSIYPPRSACPECFGELEWQESDGTGTLYSYTVLHHPDPTEAVPEDDTPILGGIAELGEGVRIATQIVGCDLEAAEIGMELAVTFEETPDGRTVPKFEPA